MNTCKVFTSAGEPQGYIDFSSLSTLWVHTGTNCNLRCSSCFEHASPGDSRIQQITLSDVEKVLDEALDLGVCSFGFTGGEPFMNPDFLSILEYTLLHAPCLVLSNGTGPLLNSIDSIQKIAQSSPHPLSIRISVDYPEKEKHDAIRGKGMFAMALTSLKKLNGIVDLAIARRIDPQEDFSETTKKYQSLFLEHGLPRSIPIVGFPNLLTNTPTPEISENCIKTYVSPEHRKNFMCATSRMLIKKNEAISIFACTLVDDDDFYDFGKNLREAIQKRTMLKHKRCFACFSSGVSCTG